MSSLEGRDIHFSVEGENHVIKGGTYIKAQEEFLPLCKMCKKFPTTCDNQFIKEVEVPIEPNDDLTLEVRGRRRLPSGEMSEEMGLGFKIVDGVKTGIYKTEDDMPEMVICHSFDLKKLG